MKHKFSLIPFGDCALKDILHAGKPFVPLVGTATHKASRRHRSTDAIEILGSISRDNNQLSLQYHLEGDLSKIIIPPPSKTPTRQYDLWEHTCFELFLRLKDTTKYWEFNLSPAGDWNVFNFSNYRQNIAEDKAIVSLPFKVFQTTKYLQLSLNFDLNFIIKPEQDLDIAIATVVENQERELSYWALVHQDKSPDFHHFDSFIINL